MIGVTLFVMKEDSTHPGSGLMRMGETYCDANNGGEDHGSDPRDSVTRTKRCPSEAEETDRLERSH